MPERVYIKTFGCQMNEYDSEKMLALLQPDFVRSESAEEAELVLVNTCSVREKGEHKLFSLLGELRELKARKPELVLGVGGCVAQQEGDAIMARSPGVDFVVGTHNLSLIPSLVRGAKSGLKRQVAVNYREEWEDLPAELALTDDGTNRVRALISIQRGCNKNCAYCVVPKTRGAETSRAPEEILREVRLKVRSGAKEVLLLGQSVNSYGRDLSPRYSFERLIEEIAAVPEVLRIRFISPHPAEVRSDFIELYGRVPSLCPQIHLPLQSGSDAVLRSMNRNYRMKRYREIVSELRERVPHIALSTDIIVGFPTETDEDFEATIAAVQEFRFHSAYYFKYSPRPNTRAITTYPNLLPSGLTDKRFQRLHALQNRIAGELNAELHGKTVSVLVERDERRISSGTWRGRTAENLLVEVYSGEMAPAGSFLGQLIDVSIVSSSPHCLRGTVC